MAVARCYVAAEHRDLFDYYSPASLHEGWRRLFFLVCSLSVLTEARAGHDFDVSHAFCFLSLLAADGYVFLVDCLIVPLL